MKKLFGILLAGALCAAAFTGCSPSGSATPSSETTPSSAPAVSSPDSSASPASGAPVKITVGASPTPHAEILEVCKPILAEQGYDLEIKEFTDYIQPNLAVEDGDIDANYFQHITYLNDFNEKNKTHLVSVTKVHYEPFGIYPGKTKSLAELKDGATVAVPNDTTNEARALLLLQANGLIKLKDGAGLEATKRDIVENSKNLDIKEIDAPQLPRTIEDVDIACINGNYALQANLDPATDPLAVEASDSDAAEAYANVLCVKEGNETNPAVQALAAALTSQTIKDYINANYKGAVVPV